MMLQEPFRATDLIWNPSMGVSSSTVQSTGMSSSLITTLRLSKQTFVKSSYRVAESTYWNSMLSGPW